MGLPFKLGHLKAHAKCVSRSLFHWPTSDAHSKSASQRMSRPSASVFPFSTLMPARVDSTSSGRYAFPLTEFSTVGTCGEVSACEGAERGPLSDFLSCFGGQAGRRVKLEASFPFNLHVFTGRLSYHECASPICSVNAAVSLKPHHETQAHRQLRLHHTMCQAHEQRRAAHVLLHELHAGGRLEVEAAAVKAHSLGAWRATGARVSNVAAVSNGRNPRKLLQVHEVEVTAVQPQALHAHVQTSSSAPCRAFKYIHHVKAQEVAKKAAAEHEPCDRQSTVLTFPTRHTRGRPAPESAAACGTHRMSMSAGGRLLALPTVCTAG